jgi:ammonium transporter
MNLSGRLQILFLIFLIGSLGLPGGGLALEGEAAGKPIKTLSDHAASMDMMWTLIASFLIFLMQAGFTLVEVGFTRAKNAGNVVMKNMIDFALGSIGFFLIGYGLMFGTSAAGLFGTGDFFLTHITSAGKVDNWKFANLMFQVVFAATAATIVSGAMSERAKFIGYLFYSLLISTLIYPVVGHWIWGGGWLAQKGMIDFSGSTVVHSVGGWVSLAGVLVLGPRLGRHNRDGSVNVIPGHNIPLVALGVFILWFGWFGFNTGNTLSATNPSIALIAVNTILAGASGALCTMAVTWVLRGKPDVGMTLNGILSGLVSCTGGVAIISPFSAAAIGSGRLYSVFFPLGLRAAPHRRPGGGHLRPRSERDLGNPGGGTVRAGAVCAKQPRICGQRPFFRGGIRPSGGPGPRRDLGLSLGFPPLLAFFQGSGQDPGTAGLPRRRGEGAGFRPAFHDLLPGLR